MLLGQNVGKHSARPKSNYPPTTHGTRKSVAHPIFERQLMRPPIDPDGFEHLPHFRPGIRCKTCPRQEQVRPEFPPRQCVIFLPPSIVNLLVQEDRFSWPHRIPVGIPDRESGRSQNEKG